LQRKSKHTFYVQELVFRKSHRLRDNVDKCSRDRALVGKPEGRRPLGRLRRRWEDNTKMDLREVGCGG
jgi:hypothetical protein